MENDTGLGHAIDSLLESVCEAIQLSDTQDSAARSHYRVVTNWLADCPVLDSFSPHIFPQGSQNLGTTTKPVGKQEFDLDAVCLLRASDLHHPGELYGLVWNRLRENGTYRKRIKQMPRCIRINYAGDFHLDIVPAVPDLSRGGNHILVPELDANLSLEDPQNNNWKTSNPTDYGRWFEDRCVLSLALREKYAKAQIDPIPDKESISDKPPLKRVVQLIKRWRDIEYEQKPKLAPPSIILTTLSGMFYRGEASCSHATSVILDAICQWLETDECLCLTSPANSDEQICEKWQSNHDSFVDFSEAICSFAQRWQRLQTLRGVRLQNELTELFGESVVQSAYQKLTETQVIAPRAVGALQAAPVYLGLLLKTPVPHAVPVRSNTFFGDD